MTTADRLARKCADAIIAYTIREDARGPIVAKMLFGAALGEGTNLRIADLILAWLHFHADQHQITGYQTATSHFALRLLSGLEK